MVFGCDSVRPMNVDVPCCSHEVGGVYDFVDHLTPLVNDDGAAFSLLFCSCLAGG